MVINADGARSVVIPAMQPHQHLIRRLAQGVDRDEPGGLKDGGWVITSRFEEGCQTAEHLRELLP